MLHVVADLILLAARPIPLKIQDVPGGWRRTSMPIWLRTLPGN
jgi:hypothetical protein